MPTMQVAIPFFLCRVVVDMVVDRRKPALIVVDNQLVLTIVLAVVVHARTPTAPAAVTLVAQIPFAQPTQHLQRLVRRQEPTNQPSLTFTVKQSISVVASLIQRAHRLEPNWPIAQSPSLNSLLALGKPFLFR